MAEESDLEKTESPTGRRLEQAREEGQVPHSRELSAFLVLITAAGFLWFLGAWLFQRLARVIEHSLVIDGALVRNPTLLPQRLGDTAAGAMLAIAPLMGALLVASMLAPFLLNAWVFAPNALIPKFGRLNPISGVGRIVSLHGLVELFKAMGKAAIVGGVAAWALWHQLDGLVGLLAQPVEAGLADAGRIVVFSFVIIVSAMALIVAIDVPFQIWQYYDKLKMTKEEVKQEGKELEGNPEVKGRIRSLQREAARKRMMAAVPQADVIVTNPTHYSVALAYQNGMKAPKILAKGRGELAAKIREIGFAHGVPMLEAPPLARALYRWAEIDDFIPTRLYAAVAEVLAYVYQLNTYRESGGRYPMPPQELPVPRELDPEAAYG